MITGPLPEAIQRLLPAIEADGGRVRAATLLQILGAGVAYVQQHVAQIDVALGAQSPGLDALENLVAKTRAAGLTSAATIARQHVISQSLLRQFTENQAPAGRVLARYDLLTGNILPTGTKGVGWVLDFVKIDSASTESIWQRVENSLAQAIAAAHAGTVLADPLLVETLRNAIALHHVRHPQTKDNHERIWVETRDSAVSRIATTPLAAEAFRRNHHGIHPAGVEALQMGAEVAVERLTNAVDNGVVFRLRVEDLFDKICDRFAGHGLEILTPANPDKEYVIGDVPALAVDFATGAAGLAQGVGLANANAVILPLAPRVLVALGPADATASAPDPLVDSLNALQVRAAERYVYHRPGADFVSFITAIRPPTTTP